MYSLFTSYDDEEQRSVLFDVDMFEIARKKICELSDQRFDVPHDSKLLPDGVGLAPGLAIRSCSEQESRR